MDRIRIFYTAVKASSQTLDDVDAGETDILSPSGYPVAIGVVFRIFSHPNQQQIIEYGGGK
jgi:hypothetical protein